jgi:acyl-CoA reductase-like NAD-dependent aldehyde dehydrogenase
MTTRKHELGPDTTLASALASFEGRSRLRVTKTYKMYVGGAFVRSESGRYFQVRGNKVKSSADPETVNIPLGSRKDVRDAILAAKAAQEKWAARTAYNRGQVLYRLAEVLDARRAELEASLIRSGAPLAEATREVDCAVDRTVFYAGFCDKIASLIASSNPVSGPHFGFSVPEPMGIIGVITPSRPALLGLVTAVVPIVAGGNSAVVVAGADDPRTAVVFSECLATSDLPGGVINVLTGFAADLAQHLVRHREVAGIDAYVESAELRQAIECDASDSVKRVKTRAPLTMERIYDERSGQGLSFIERFLETKTVWHPVGL